MANGYQPLEFPNFLGIALEAQRSRQQEQQFRAEQEERRALRNARYFKQAAELTAQTDFKTGLAWYREQVGNDYSEDQETILKSIDKASKQRKKQAEQGVQYQQTGSQFEQGIAETFAPLARAKLEGRTPTPEEQALFGQAITAASQGLGDSPFLRGLIQSGVAAGQGIASREQRIRSRPSKRGTKSGEITPSEQRQRDKAQQEADYAWQQFEESGQTWNEWKAEAQDVPGRRKDVIAAMNHPNYLVLRRIQQGTPLPPGNLTGNDLARLVAAQEFGGLGAAPPPSAGGRPVTPGDFAAAGLPPAPAPAPPPAPPIGGEGWTEVAPGVRIRRK